MPMLAEEEQALPQLERHRPIGFLEAVGERAALFGDPDAGLELWLWPMEVLRNLRFHLRRGPDEPPLEAEKLDHSARVRPEGFELVWSLKGLELRVEAFAPRDKRAMVLLLHYRGRRDLWVDLEFVPVLRPMWPAGLGGQTLRRDSDSGALVLGEELGRYAVLFGSPESEAWQVGEERGAGQDPLRFSIPLSSARAKKGPTAIVLAGAEVRAPGLSSEAQRGADEASTGWARSTLAVDAARKLWREVLGDWHELRDQERDRWRANLKAHARLQSDDDRSDAAFFWSKVAMERSWVQVDDLGRSMVAGIGPSRGTARPGYAWFFGGDALSAVRALSAIGDFAAASELLRFVASTQREDGKLMHELSLSAGLCEWTESYPYAWYKGQVTPGFVAVVAAHLRACGDTKLARELWPHVLRALRWCHSVTDEQGHMLVPKAGIAAVEAGPLAGRIRCETFLQGIWISALAGAREMVQDYGLEAEELELEAWEELARRGFEDFWSDPDGAYGFALLEDGERCDDSTAYTALPLSRGIGEAGRARSSAARLTRPELCADWGARMFAENASVYDPEHYNTGAVFPYLTGFVTLALYQHGPLAAAHASLDSQVALCGFDGAGLMPEHLEGQVARTPRRGVPHQLFSSAALLQSFVHGLLGFRPDARAGRVLVQPAMPPTWMETHFERLRVGATRFDLTMERGRSEGHTRLRARFVRRDGPKLRVRWQPVLPPLSLPSETGRVQGEEVRVQAERMPSGALVLRPPEAELDEKLVFELEFQAGPEIQLPPTELERDAPSRGPRLVAVHLTDETSAAWVFAGRPGSSARMYFTSDREMAIEGASFKKGELVLEFPKASSDTPGEWSEATVALRAPTS